VYFTFHFSQKLIKKKMKQEEILRQEAVRLHLQGESIQSIVGRINRSRQWVYKWIARYTQDSQDGWYLNESNAPKKVTNRIDKSVENSILSIRNKLQNQPYAQTGAISIMYEMRHLGLEAPSLPTINRVLSRNNLVSQSSVKTRKNTEYPTFFTNVQQMDLIVPKYLKGGFRFYLFDIIDVETHFAGVYPILNKSAESITPCVTDFWRNFQMPDFLQMDNELSFRGRNRHPHGLGLLMRAALSNGVSPLFVPPAEPWRNGVVEKFNGNVLTHFYQSETFASFEEMYRKAKEFSCFHNENHRYSSQAYKTPKQMISCILQKSKLERDIDLTQKIFVEEGRLIFIRFIRSDLKLSILIRVLR
jgi:transposase InsO family protein